MNSISRRGFFGAAGLSLAAITGCSKARNPLRIFVYAGGHEKTMSEVFVPKYPSGKVELIAGWWDGMPKLKTAPINDPPFDLMITDATQGYPAAREGLFAKLDLDWIPNTKSLVPATLDNWIYKGGHGLTYPDAVMTLAHSKMDDPPTRWGDLLQPKYSNKLGFYSSYYMSLYTFAAMLADSNGKPGTAHELIETKIDDVFRFAIEQRKRIKLWWNNPTEMILALHEKSILAGNINSPEYLLAMREKPESLAAAVPASDRVLLQVFWAIPAGAQSSANDNAHYAINFLFSEDIQLEFCRRGMATPRVDVAAKMAKEDPFWASLYPHTEEQFRTLKYYPYDAYERYGTELTDRWDRTVLRG